MRKTVRSPQACTTFLELSSSPSGGVGAGARTGLSPRRGPPGGQDRSGNFRGQSARLSGMNEAAERSRGVTGCHAGVSRMPSTSRPFCRSFVLARRRQPDPIAWHPVGPRPGRTGRCRTQGPCRPHLESRRRNHDPQAARRAPARGLRSFHREFPVLAGPWPRPVASDTGREVAGDEGNGPGSEPGDVRATGNDRAHRQPGAASGDHLFPADRRRDRAVGDLRRAGNVGHL